MIENYYPSRVWKNCQYCGSHDILWENGTHKMFCKTCSKSFFINAAAAVIALIRNDEGKLLFTHRKNDPAAGKLDFPGGFVNIEERSEDAVIREVKEELDLDLTEVSYYTSIPNRYLYGGIVYFTLDLVYVCKCGDLSGISAKDDISGFVFMDVNEVNPEDLGLESVKKIVLNLKNSSKS
ncbi:MAG: NUDIX domain-containing protein [Prevotellaceae bacterium]|jgi:mutator protein MutT|nr:NUDIX domain-containing protein [Prevotellaceae bacterium]